MADQSKPRPLDYRSPPNPGKYVDDAEGRRWRGIRILFRIGMFVPFIPVIFYFGPNVVMFGKLTSMTPADYVPVVQQIGVPTVSAMKEYQRDTGHMPNSMDDLIPKYLASRPDGMPLVEMGGGFEFLWEYNQMVSYDFTPGHEGWWVVAGPLVHGKIPLPPVIIGPASLPATVPATASR